MSSGLLLASLSLGLVFPFLLAYAAVSDLLTMLIPNRVTLLVLAAFVVYAATAGLDWQQLASHLGAGLLTLSITFTLFAFGYIGGGDAKLAAATALWLGLEHLLAYLVVASVLGGALTLAILYFRTYPLPRFAWSYPFVVLHHDAKTGIPYGIALAAAALLVLPETGAFAQLVS